MRQCIALAKRGQGFVSPNPLVGCVIVKNGRVIGRGSHKCFGKNHAEVNAIEDAQKKGFSLHGSTFYVNLEPCAHQGKTPPCAPQVAAQEPARVVIGMPDPNPKVNGAGIRLLKQSGIDVCVGVNQDECESLNRFFLHRMNYGIPFVTLKIAQTLDGKIALQNGNSKYITSESCRKIVHRMRAAYDAVLIGRNTALLDDPLLDARMVKGRTPVRFILDKDLSLPPSLRLFESEPEKTVVVTGRRRMTDNARHRFMRARISRGRIDIPALLSQMSERGISSLLVEGGAGVFSEFLRLGLYDEILIFQAPLIAGSGVSPFDGYRIKQLADAKRLRLEKTQVIGNELMLKYAKCLQE